MRSCIGSSSWAFGRSSVLAEVSAQKLPTRNRWLLWAWGCSKLIVRDLGSLQLGEIHPPNQCLHPLGWLELLWKLLVHRCETNYEACAVAFLLIIGNKTNWRAEGLLKAIIVWLYFKKMCLILKIPQFLEVSQPREVILIIRFIYCNSLNQKYWLNEKLTRVELQMSFGFRFPEWYNY